MIKVLEVRDRTGVVERRDAGQDEVIAAPAIQLTCRVRDPLTGGCGDGDARRARSGQWAANRKNLLDKIEQEAKQQEIRLP